MNDDFYYSDDDGMSIERISEAEANEIREIEGIEDNADYSGEDIFDPNGEESALVPQEERSTPDNPLFDPETGERIPNGYTRKDWDKRKEAIAKKQAEIKARVEKERKAFEQEQQRQMQLSEEEAYLQRQYEAEEAARENLEGVVAGSGEDNIISESVDFVDENTLNSIPEETNPFQESINNNVPDNWQEEFSYSIDKENNTITLNHYIGEGEVVTIPSVAYDEEGNSYDVLLSVDENLFSDTNASFVGISSDVPEDNFSEFFERETGISYEEYAEKIENPSILDNEQVSEIKNPEENFSEQAAAEIFHEEAESTYKESEIESQYLHEDAAVEDNLQEESYMEPAFSNIPNEEADFSYGETETESQYIRKETTAEANTLEQPVSAQTSYVEQSSSNTKENSEVAVKDIVDGARNSFTEEHAGSFSDTDNIVSSNNDTTNISSKLEDLNKINSSPAYQMPDAYNDGKSDVSAYMTAEVKAQLNQTVAAQAGSVVITNATALDSDTAGSYGSDNDQSDTFNITKMLENQSTFSSMTGSEIGVNTYVQNHTMSDSVIHVASEIAARKTEANNYKEESVKESNARSYGDSTEKKVVKDIVEGARFDKESNPTASTPTSKEDLTETHSRASESAAKTKIKDYQTIRDAIESVGAMVVHNVANADDSEENDVKQGEKKVREFITDFKMVFGTSGLFAATALDAGMGVRQADLMAKASENGVNEDLLLKISEKKAEVNSFKKGSDLRKNAIKEFEKTKEDLIKELQDKGFSKNEIKDLLKKGLGGSSAAENLAAGIRARNELLKFADKNKGVFTDEQLAFLKSKGFFDTANNSRQISSLTSVFFDKSGNENLSKFNISKQYTNALNGRISGKKLGPSIVDGFGQGAKNGGILGGAAGAAGAAIDPHSYNLRPNLATTDLDLVNMKKLDKVRKKNPDAFTKEQLDVVNYQKMAIKHGKDKERKKAFDKNKFSLKNLLSISLHFLQKLDSDVSVGYGQIMAIKRGAEALYSGIKLLGKATALGAKVGAKVATPPIRFIGRKTGISAAISKATEFIDNKKAALSAAFNAKKSKIKNKALNSKPYKGLSKVKTTLNKSKPVVGIKNKINTAKTLKNGAKKFVTKKAREYRDKALNNTFVRILLLPFKGAGLIAKAINKIATFFKTVGHFILLAVGVIFLVWIILLFITGFFMSFGTSIDLMGRHVIMADQEMIEGWVEKYLALDNEKYEEAVSHAEDDPIDPYVWGGVRLYHYGVYEPTYTSYFNRNNTKCYYHESGTTEKSGATNGFHIIYIDSDGNTIGSNTTNIKDVMSVTTTMIGNDWYSYQTEAEDMQDQLYTILNPEAAYVESEIYACSTGCDTYPQKYVDGDSSKGLNWYSNSAYKAYECNDEEIYEEYERLKEAGVKFFNDETYDYMSKTYYERLVPQTANGCNVKASFKFKRVKVQDAYYEEYITLPSGLTIPDYSTYVPSVWEYQLSTVDYDYSCGGQTYVYTYDSDGYYYRSTSTSPTAYGSMYYSDDEHVSAVNGAGFYGYYSRDYSSTIPHTAIKCCYGHKDLNVYITILTKEDIIEANGGEIEYKVPVSFDHETGEVTEWTTKKTASIYTYTKTNTNLQTLTQAFYGKGGFNSEENIEMINQIYDADWHDLYNVNVYEGAAIPDTLSRETTTSKLDRTLLTDVSATRSTLVTTAYSQVGKIPYYWGGKATSTVISANKFGTTVAADYRGRTKKGLDCSGFVQLMICIAFDLDLDDVGSSTSTLVPSLGLERISYSELQPGDIGMENLPGASSNHIGIYAGGGMWIHCAGSPTNTVVYNNTNCFRYYYSLGD